ncbi:hypothetical protein PY093_00145 [Cytobacillus sp. S13-E01]|uniref:hypothetical protein n=1 Tax=Cytobacillus sp. S13-E01 TaxID=3031326 RepID=UPI0023D874D8|nr:hypothetical protein [Cytobacillus sp. S13-E01]MDF0725113.1 hypothetical protein [Cytobacillus sp. S13-E01]
MSIPKTEQQFKQLQDRYFAKTQTELSNGKRPRFKGLIEIMKSDAVVITAIHKLKANKGSKTPGTDGMVIEEILTSDYQRVMKM